MTHRLEKFAQYIKQWLMNLVMRCEKSKDEKCQCWYCHLPLRGQDSSQLFFFTVKYIKDNILIPAILPCMYSTSLLNSPLLPLTLHNIMWCLECRHWGQKNLQFCKVGNICHYFVHGLGKLISLRLSGLPSKKEIIIILTLEGCFRDKDIYNLMPNM